MVQHLVLHVYCKSFCVSIIYELILSTQLVNISQPYPVRDHVTNNKVISFFERYTKCCECFFPLIKTKTLEGILV
jgi:hypothetical protein